MILLIAVTIRARPQLYNIAVSVRNAIAVKKHKKSRNSCGMLAGSTMKKSHLHRFLALSLVFLVSWHSKLANASSGLYCNQGKK